MIEAAWKAIKKSPALLAYFRKHIGKNNKKAIVKVARKLALIAKAVALNQTAYQEDYESEKNKTSTAKISREIGAIRNSE